jgi:hypothetical protein
MVWSSGLRQEPLGLILWISIELYNLVAFRVEGVNFDEFKSGGATWEARSSNLGNLGIISACLKTEENQEKQKYSYMGDSLTFP